MNRHNENEKDLLKQFLNRETFEKAPEGFALKTMARIRLENRHPRARLSIPVISLLVIFIFVLIILVMPETQNSYNGLPFFNFIKDIKISVPDLRLDIGPLPKMDLPGWALCFFGALFLLGILDMVLSGIFSRDR